MYKTASTVLLALGLASAAQVDHLEIDAFNPVNFMKLDVAKTLVKSVTDEPVQGKGDVTFTQCDDDAKVFTFDGSSTTYTPNPITKGSKLSFSLAGAVQSKLEITDIHMHVTWNGTPLYDNDYKQDNTYTSTYSYTMGYDVPSFAPSGNYDVLITGTGNAAGKSGAKVLCIEAKMVL